VARAHQSLGSNELRALELDLGLIEEVDPAAVENISQRHGAIIDLGVRLVLAKQITQRLQHGVLAPHPVPSAGRTAGTDLSRELQSRVNASR
jgi:hypothetical protein